VRRDALGDFVLSRFGWMTVNNRQQLRLTLLAAVLHVVARTATCTLKYHLKVYLVINFNRTQLCRQLSTDDAGRYANLQLFTLDLLFIFYVFSFCIRICVAWSPALIGIVRRPFLAEYHLSKIWFWGRQFFPSFHRHIVYTAWFLVIFSIAPVVTQSWSSALSALRRSTLGRTR